MMGKHSTLRILKYYADSFLTATIIVLQLLRAGAAYISNINASDINNALLKYRIIPDLLREPPLHLIKATYSFGDSPNLGNKIKAKYLKNNPYVILWPCAERQYYTLLLIDLDAPSPIQPTKREWLHYLSGNIPGLSISQGQILAPYVRPTPQEGTHRLVFLVYRQHHGRINFREKKLEYTTDPARAYFSSKNFAMKYKLGDPFACNFFLVDAPEPTTEIPPVENVTQFNEKLVSSSRKPVTRSAKPTTSSEKPFARNTTLAIRGTKPVTSSSTKPVTSSITKPVTSSSTKPVTSSSTKPVTSSSTKPVTSSSTKPVTSNSTKPVTKSIKPAISGNEPVTNRATSVEDTTTIGYRFSWY